MEELKPVIWYNLPKVVNDNFEAVEEAINALEAGEITPAAPVANIVVSTLPVVPALADTAAVKTYLDSLYTPLEARLDLIEGKVNTILAVLRAAKIINT